LAWCELRWPAMDDVPRHGFVDDAVGRRLQTLVEALERELGPAVQVERDPSCGEVLLQPARPDAMPVGWSDFEGQELQLWLGASGCWWEVGRTLEDMVVLEDVVRSIVAGRVQQILAPGRSKIVVRLSDGSLDRYTHHEAPVGCIPLPLWPRWSRHIRYAPYAETT
jgi:hypothetical protein